jgi:hypothetical protein
LWKKWEVIYLKNSGRAEKPTYAMIQYFENRTNYHISLVRKYLDKIIALNDPRLDLAALEEEKEQHDLSKFKEPEYTPYLHVNWKYYMKERGAEYIPSNIIKRQMHNATFHHISTNKHHPDYWDDKLAIDNLNSIDRDKPPEKMVDATKMPLTYAAAMIADWLAMSDEKKTDPFKWAKDNINIRWKFTKEQEEFIYDLISKLWKD